MGCPGAVCVKGARNAAESMKGDLRARVSPWRGGSNCVRPRRIELQLKVSRGANQGGPRTAHPLKRLNPGGIRRLQLGEVDLEP